MAKSKNIQKKSKSKEQIFKEVTDHVISSLENGNIPWEKPWRSVNGVQVKPMNINGRAYRGWNLIRLSSEMAERGLTDPRFLTFGQIVKAGALLAKGSKSVVVDYWIKIYFHEDNPDCKLTKKDYLKHDDSCDKKRLTWYTLKQYRVFSVEDVTGLNLKSIEVEIEENKENFDAVLEADKVVEDYVTSENIKLNYKGDRAYYSPMLDEITVPETKNFKGNNAYYNTIFHEIGHSTGHQSRLNREGVANNEPIKFGDELYAKEELVAEMTSGFLCASTGTNSRFNKKNRVAYIQSWITALKEDSTLVPQASQFAQKAFDYIMK